MLPFFPPLIQPSPSLFKQISSDTPSTGYLLLTMLMYRAFCHNSSRFTHPPCPVIYFPFHPSLCAPVRCKNQSPLDFAISRWPPIHPFANFETISPQNHTIKSITISRLASTVPGPRYQEAAVNIHYRSPVRWEEKDPLSEDELRRRQEDNMRRVYEEARRRKEERQAEDRESRRHGDNFT